MWIIPEIRKLGINGVTVKGYGSAGMNNVEWGAIAYEMSRADGSITVLFNNHHGIGSCVVDQLGNEEQKARLLKDTISMNKLFCFCLTEPDHGSDIAFGLSTSATKVEGGWLLNGVKRWIGNGTFADYFLVWARNEEDDNKIQCFVAEKGAKGLTATKI
jgi:glutaryl-CoA dehydrogenase